MGEGVDVGLPEGGGRVALDQQVHRQRHVRHRLGGLGSGQDTHSCQSAPFLKGMPLFKGFLAKLPIFAPFYPFFFITNPFFLPKFV